VNRTSLDQLRTEVLPELLASTRAIGEALVQDGASLTDEG
jgi:hypothetical protein